MTATEFQPSTHCLFALLGAALGVETPHPKQRFQRGFNSLQHEDPSTLFFSLSNCNTTTYTAVEC
jgi:hypothetical protein